MATKPRLLAASDFARFQRESESISGHLGRLQQIAEAAYGDTWADRFGRLQRTLLGLKAQFAARFYQQTMIATEDAPKLPPEIWYSGPDTPIDTKTIRVELSDGRTIDMQANDEAVVLFGDQEMRVSVRPVHPCLDPKTPPKAA